MPSPATVLSVFHIIQRFWPTLKPAKGAIVVDGKPVSFASPRDAIQAGIGMIHQHFMLVQSQTVTENILLDDFGT